jgi:CubicO group peptidase (beta-lactamase class C family)
MRRSWFALVGLVAVLGIAAIVLQACVSARSSDKVVAGPAGAISWQEADAIIARARELKTSALLVVKDGKEILAWGDVDAPADVRSMRKSVNNLILGRLSLAGKVKLDATLADLGIDEPVDPLTATEKSATLQQVMESRSGVFRKGARETGSWDELRPARGAYPPGAFWIYSNWDFNVAEKVTADLSGVADWCAAFERDAAPLLGIPAGAKRCEVQKEDISAYAAHRVKLSPRELVKLAQIYLDDGKADGQRVLPEGWAAWSVEPVSDFHFQKDSKFNYGRLFWSIDPYGPFQKQSFMMRGAGSQYVWVAPEANLIIVHLVRTEPLMLRKWMGLIPDDNDAWTFGAEIGSAVLAPQMKRPSPVLY